MAETTGPNLSYVVNAVSKERTADAAVAVTAAGGTVTVLYAQIGVVVARSTKPSFVQAVKGAAHGDACQRPG